MNAISDSPSWAVRLAPSGLLLADHLHRAEAEGFALAWNRLEADPSQRAVIARRAQAPSAPNAAVREAARRAAAGVRRSRAG